MRRKIIALALTIGAVVFGVASPAAADTALLGTHLTGEAEVPGPGDDDASGRAVVIIDQDDDELCLFLRFSRVDGTLSGLHIHEAPAGEAGPVVVPFATPAASFTFQCVDVNGNLLDDIAANPSDYYLNLHSAPDFGPGAIRGQLDSLI